MYLQAHSHPDSPTCQIAKKASNERKIGAIKQEYDSHLAQYPGFYNVKEGFDSKHNEAYRKWVGKKLELEEKIRIYSMIDNTHNLTEVFFNPGLMPSRLSRGVCYDMEIYYKSYMESIEYMATLKNRSKEWVNERIRAAHLRKKVISQAEIEGSPLPNPLPKLPEVKR